MVNACETLKSVQAHHSTYFPHMFNSLLFLILQRKSIKGEGNKEPKPESETKEEQQKEVLPSKDDSTKSIGETVDKPVPQPPVPEDDSERYFSAHQVIEYQWPPDRTGEFYLLRHHVCQFLETEGLEEKYPGELSYCDKCLQNTFITALFTCIYNY